MSNTTVFMKGPGLAGGGSYNITISTIGSLNIPVGQSYDLSQHISDQNSQRTSTTVNGLAGFASYDNTPFAERLVGVTGGQEEGLTLTVNWPTGTVNSNVFEADVTLWNTASIGDATGSVVANTDTNLTITATGTNDYNIDIAYKTISSGDIEIIARVPSGWTGHSENSTGFGVGLREGLALGDYFAQTWRPTIGPVKAKYGTDASNTGVDGTAATTLPRYVAVTYDQSQTQIGFWESSDGASWIQIGSFVSKTLTYPVYGYVFGTSHDAAQTTTATLTACDVSNSLSIYTPVAVPSGPRSLRMDMSFESGGINGATYQEGGVYVDAMVIKQSARRASITVTNISNTNPAICTYSGTRVQNGDGVTFAKTGGITQLRDRLVRAKDTSATQFTCYWDGTAGDPEAGWNDNQICDTDKYPNPQPDNTRDNSTTVNANGYGTFGASTTADLWEQYDGTPRSTDDVRVVASKVPPDNLIGSGGAAVTPLRGSYLLSTEIFFDRDHAFFDGNSFKNKPRFTCNNGQGNKGFAHNQEEWMSISYFLPPNYHDDPENRNFGSTNLIQTNAGGDGGLVFWDLQLGRFPNGATNAQWTLVDYAGNEIPIGDHVVDGDVGKWTTFIFRQKAHASTGILQVWKSSGPYTSGLQRDMTRVYSKVNAQTTANNSPVGDYAYGFRQYKHGWHHNQNTINSKSIWMGWDEIRWGGVNEGTGYSDVDPWQRDQP